MAFVYRGDRILNTTNDDLDKVGPGSYLSHTEYQFRKGGAPFNTNAIRSPPKKEHEITPGPGCYDVEPFNDGEKVVLYSGVSDVRVLEIPKPSFNFRSQTNRFIANKIDVTPGPGQYNVNTATMQKSESVSTFQKNSNNIIEHMMTLNKYQSIPSIPSQNQVYGYTEKYNNELELNKNPEGIHSGMQTDSVGPPQYTIKDTFELNKNKGAAWHKSKVCKLFPSVSKDQEFFVGPGAYEIDSQMIPYYKTKASVGFKSRTNRIFDQRKGEIAQEFVANRTKEQQKKYLGKQPLEEDEEEDEGEFIDDATPGPGHYSYSNNSISTASSRSSLMRSKNSTSEFKFGTHEKRFKVNEQKQINVGPGQYELIITQQKTPSIQHPPFQSSDTRFQAQIKEVKPGPQAYNTQQSLEDQLIKKLQKGPIGNFGSNVKRFQISQLADEIPGPGQYQIQKNNLEQTKNQIQGSFKSNIIREAFTVKKEIIPPPGAYDVENFNIEKAVRVEKEEDPDLAVKKPPFNSSIPRFDLEAKNKDTEDNDDDDLPKTNNKNINSLFMKKKAKNIPFNVEVTKRFQYNEEKMPGPGDYFDTKKNLWSKRTYNILFAEI